MRVVADVVVVVAGEPVLRDGAVPRALVELHGGTLEIRSQKSVGTEVSVYLPSRSQVQVTQSHEAIQQAAQIA